MDVPPPSKLTETLAMFAIYNTASHLQTTHISIMMMYKNCNKLGSVDICPWIIGLHA
jgi:hypothetical protein